MTHNFIKHFFIILSHFKIIIFLTDTYHHTHIIRIEVLCVIRLFEKKKLNTKLAKTSSNRVHA